MLVYDYNLSWFHRDQHIVDTHSDNFRIDIRWFLQSRNILICAEVCYGQAYQRKAFDKSWYALMGVVPLSKCFFKKRFNKIAIQGTPQMAVDKEAIIFLSRVYSY